MTSEIIKKTTYEINGKIYPSLEEARRASSEAFLFSLLQLIENKDNTLADPAQILAAVLVELATMPGLTKKKLNGFIDILKKQMKKKDE